MDSINWKQYLDDVANLDILEALEEQIDKFKDAVQAAVAKLCEPLQVMPAETQLLFRKQRLYSAHHKQCIIQTVPYVLKILPRAHVSKVLKRNVRTILSLGRHFTLNLNWARQWTPFINGCRNTLLALGRPLERAYEEGNLRHLLGDYNPVPNDEAAEQGVLRHATAHASTSRLRQYVPPQCAPSAFTPHFSLRNAHLEASTSTSCGSSQ